MEPIIHNELGKMLQQAHTSIVPEDSWNDLRSRINNRLQDGIDSRTHKEIVRWRSLCISLAACLLLVSGLLINSMSFNLGIRQNLPGLDSDYHRLSLKDVENLTVAFANIRQLFSDENPWIVFGPNKETTMGINNGMTTTFERNKFVVLRLVIKTGTASPSRYYDIVTFPNKSATFKTPFTDEADILITVKPKLNNGKIEVEYEAQINGGSVTNSIASLDNNDFTQLVGMGTNKGRVDIFGIAKIVSEI